MKRATVTVKVEEVQNAYSPYSGTGVDGVLDLSITETCSSDLDIARLLKRLAHMVHPKVDEL